MHEVRMVGENIPCRGAFVNGHDVSRDDEKTYLTGLEGSHRIALP